MRIRQKQTNNKKKEIKGTFGLLVTGLLEKGFSENFGKFPGQTA